MLCALVMAGGKGERFWPLSTDEKPKQFLNLLGKDTMIQMTVKRLQNILPIDRIFVVACEKYIKLLRSQLPNLPQRNIISEPIGRNTAPCIALSAFIIKRYYDNVTMLVVPADHLIVNEEKYFEIISKGYKFIDKNHEAVVTFGITPDRPETEYGYIKLNKVKFRDSEKIYKVENFTEKPDIKTAESYIRCGEYLWNSGMFMWKVNYIINLTKKYLHSTYEVICELQKSQEYDFHKVLSKTYKYVDNVSIDYGIMENIDDIYVIPSDFGWDDVGTWKSVERYSKKDLNNNVQIGNIKYINSTNNIVMGKKKSIVIVGISDILVAETDDVIFIGKKENIDNIKEIKKKINMEDME
ncbi:mannose-1-phosphate guanylyltransferase [Clostridium tyrobutyricum]|uniref:mannose-1-phosphate guanylyltransferase n=1 Tax=Clostridium tyrobutyricum TaxID=1519 RepID=UPI001C37F026|nr:mannose-1-phosphate guanylyltransferase [Clostridium tyrobutyricum]MBV4428321.1 mannose-1-phosphate guanylyltransferase [Clostridium tyrobutyricum]MBV4443311.1 mannose-1-phosphate guanylyltransferase [Clostridium tyrobutyricum]